MRLPMKKMKKRTKMRDERFVLVTSLDSCSTLTLIGFLFSKADITDHAAITRHGVFTKTLSHFFFVSEADITHHATWDEGMSHDSTTASSDTEDDASTQHAGERV